MANGRGKKKARATGSAVKVEVENGIQFITLNRPERLNTFTLEMFDAFGAAIDQAHRNEKVRGVVIAGAGRVFCAGLDINLFTLLHDKTIHNPTGRDFLRMAQDVFIEKIEALEKPVICCWHGVAAGGGFEIGIGCDFRIMTRDARAGCTEVRLGVIPEAGGCHRLSRIVGLGRAKELVMTGKMIGAEEAERIGLVNRVVPTQQDLKPAAIEFLNQFKACGPLAVGLAKKAIDRSFGMDPRAGLELEVLTGNVLYATEDAYEGYRAFIEKRKPKYRGR